MFLFGGMNNMAKTYMKLDGNLVPISVGTVGTSQKKSKLKQLQSQTFQVVML